MRLTKIETVDKYNEIIQQYQKKGCLTNDFLHKEVSSLVKDGKLYEYCTDENAFLFVKKDIGLRLYYYLNNIDSIADFDIEDDLVVEILFRGEKGFPKEEVDYLLRCGFIKHILRDQYSALYKDIQLTQYDVPGLNIYIAKTIEEIEYAVKLFNQTFDNYTGNYIPLTECDGLLDDRCILIAKLDSEYAGAMHFRRDGKLIWAEHNVVERWCRGKHIGNQLCNAFIETAKIDEHTRYTRWTQHAGQAAKMYEKLGFKYVNKSSFSMLKLYNNKTN